MIQERNENEVSPEDDVLQELWQMYLDMLTKTKNSALSLMYFLGVNEDSTPESQPKNES